MRESNKCGMEVLFGSLRIASFHSQRYCFSPNRAEEFQHHHAHCTSAGAGALRWVWAWRPLVKLLGPTATKFSHTTAIAQSATENQKLNDLLHKGPSSATDHESWAKKSLYIFFCCFVQLSQSHRYSDWSREFCACSAMSAECNHLMGNYL